MDIRNITEKPKEVHDSEMLSEMYKLSNDQFKGYQEIEELPNYPININNKKNQIVLKDFISRVIEELIEGYESTEYVHNFMKEYGWNVYKLTDEEYQEVLNHLQNANEEQADALGFFFPLLSYANILPEDIISYADNIFQTEDGDYLTTLMIKGIGMITEKYDNKVTHIGFSLLGPEFLDGDVDKYEKINSYTPGFNNMSEETHENEKIYLWDIIYELNLARNFLKSRPWKQTSVMTKELDFQKSLVRSFLLYLGFLGISGFTARSLYELFFKKQRLNIWRQKTQY